MEIKTREYAELWKKELKDEINNFDTKPTLVIIIAKDYYQPSSVYVNNKIKIAAELGINVKLVEIEDWEEKDKNLLLFELKVIINSYEGCSIICQLPFPQLSEEDIAEILPEKFDVDGFTNYQKGLLASGSDKALVPCTALGVMKLLKYVHGDVLDGQPITIVSRSNLIGKPLLQLALQNNMTPTVIHSKTSEEDKISALQFTSIVVTGCGKRKLFNHKDFNYGQINTIIDCSMDKVSGIPGVGDCDKEKILEFLPNVNIASGYGHTGLMTVLGLCENVVKAHKLSIGGSHDK